MDSTGVQVGQAGPFAESIRICGTRVTRFPLTRFLVHGLETPMKAPRKGEYVKHALYGFGLVTAADSQRTSIDFDIHGMKKFVTSLMTIEPAGEAPPRPRSRRRAKAAAATA